MREIKFRVWDGEEMGVAQYMRLPAQSNEYLKVMQYTGLKDRNGKEIYESDILLVGGKSYVVTWDRYRFELPGYYDSSNDNPTDYFSERWTDEVIGNIWDNPELLGGQT